MRKIAILFTLMGFAVSLHAQQAAPCYPMWLGGVQMGVNEGYHVARHGRGWFVPDATGTYEVYYTDKSHTLTLYVSVGLDRNVRTIRLSRGIKFPAGTATNSFPWYVESINLTQVDNKTFYQWGQTPEDVIKNLGMPSDEQKTSIRRSLRYEFKGPQDGPKCCKLNYYAVFEFITSKLQSVEIHCGE